MSTPYTYIILRKDIPPVQHIVQAAHAALEAGFRFEQPIAISHLIVLEVENESELHDAAKQLQYRGIDYYQFFEPDNGMGYSALCTRPILEKYEQNFFKRWNLFTPMQTEVL